MEVLSLAVSALGLFLVIPLSVILHGQFLLALGLCMIFNAPILFVGVCALFVGICVSIGAICVAVFIAGCAIGISLGAVGLLLMATGLVCCAIVSQIVFCIKFIASRICVKRPKSTSTPFSSIILNPLVPVQKIIVVEDVLAVVPVASTVSDTSDSTVDVEKAVIVT